MSNNISLNNELISECIRRFTKEYRRARGIENPSDLITKFPTKAQLDAFLDAENAYINERFAVLLKGDETNV